MRKLALLLAFLGLAAAPKAVVKAPSAVQSGSLVRIDTSGTVSDSPVDIFAFPLGPGDGPQFAADGSLLGWRLVAPGPITFFVTATGVPPGSNLRLTDIGSATVEVMPAGPPVVPSPPGKPPAPLTPPAADALSAGAKAYIQAMPSDFTRAAADLESGKLKTVADINKAIADYRRSGGDVLAAEMNRRFAAGSDAAGVVMDVPGIASALRQIGAAQQGVLKP